MDCFVRDWKETLFLLISVMKIPAHKLHYQIITCQVFNIFLSQQGSSSTSITVHWQWGRRLCSWVCRDDQKTASCCKKRSPSNSRCRKRRFGWSSEFTGRRYYQPNWSQWSCREKTEGTNSFSNQIKLIMVYQPKTVRFLKVSHSWNQKPAGTCMGLVGGIL